MNIHWKWNGVASGQWISTAIVLPSGTISRCHVDVRWYGVALWGRQSPWIHSSTQWIAYCPMKWCCHQVSVTAVSQFHALGEYPLEWWCCQQSMPCIASFVPTMTVTTTVFWSRIASLHITSFTHTECSLNHQYLLCHRFKHNDCPLNHQSLSSHQFHAHHHWMFSESPVSVVSPV